MLILNFTYPQDVFAYPRLNTTGLGYAERVWSNYTANFSTVLVFRFDGQHEFKVTKCATVQCKLTFLHLVTMYEYEGHYLSLS
jgi:hypothetical protein